MTEGGLPLAGLLATAGDGDLRRSVAEAVPTILIEADVEGLIGAGLPIGPFEAGTVRAAFLTSSERGLRVVTLASRMLTRG